jgi:uncharacterized membrane protein YkvI
LKSANWKQLVLPGLVFQSTLIGGGYATGRELVEFFLQLGPLEGLLSMALATVIFSVVSCVAFEFARVFSCYDYRSFFRLLLGPFWGLFEVVYLCLVLLVLSVIGAAAGALTHSVFGVEPLWGTVALMALTTVFLFLGSDLIERFLSIWSILLYVGFAVLVGFCFSRFPNVILDNLSTTQSSAQVSVSLGSGVAYAGYNLAVLTAVFFTVRHLHTRKDVMIAGFLSGPLAMIPGAMLYLAMLTQYPQILDEPVPINYLLEIFKEPGLTFVLQLIIFGTFVETVTALLHAINERISSSYHSRGKLMPRYQRPMVALTFVLLAIYLANTVGLIALIAQGYTYSGYLVLLVFVLPLFTRGVYLIWRRSVRGPGTVSN